LVPATPVNADAGSAGSSIVPPTPVTMLHCPVPTVGATAARTAFVPHVSMSTPASAAEGPDSNTIVTSSVVLAQVAVIVQRSTYVSPATPVNIVPGASGSAKDPPLPLTMDHWPTPTVGVLASSVAEVVTVLHIV